MSVKQRRCTVCREYFDADKLRIIGVSGVCSDECLQGFYEKRRLKSTVSDQRVCIRDNLPTKKRVANEFTRHCVQCAKKFSTAQLQKKYCTPKCRARAERQKKRHGGPIINKGAVRAAVIERDLDACLLCGKPPGALQLHRVKYGSEGGKYVVENCVQLCAHDHLYVVHADKRVWQPLLLEYLGRRQTDEQFEDVRIWLAREIAERSAPE